MNKVRIGIIGLGNMGSNHAKTITAGDVPDMELTAMCDISETRRDFLKKKYPDIPVFEKAEDLYQSGLVDAVCLLYTS